MNNSRKCKTRKARNEFLGEYIPHLLNRVACELVRGIDEKFRSRRLTICKWRILAALSDRGVCQFGELADLTSIEPATLSRFVTSLVQQGLVRRTRSTSDARAVRITLTEAGETAFTLTLPWASQVENNLVHGLDPDDVAKLKRMLKTMFSNLCTKRPEHEEGDESAASDARVLDL